jgi:hypothetical protein
MRRQYWAYGFYVLLSVSFLMATALSAGGDASLIAALVRLPHAGTDAATASGAIFAGVLDGPVVSTATGHIAVAWIGAVTVTRRVGRGTYKYEKCRLGAIDDLRLDTDGGGRVLSIRAPDLRAIDMQTGLVRPRLEVPHYDLGQATHVSLIPQAVIERCALNREELKRGEWAYDEYWAHPGSHVEIAGCKESGAVGACADGVAVGHLTVGGARLLVRRLADQTMLMASALSLAISFFHVVGGGGAVLSLLGAARRGSP